MTWRRTPVVCDSCGADTETSYAARTPGPLFTRLFRWRCPNLCFSEETLQELVSLVANGNTLYVGSFWADASPRRLGPAA